MFEQVNSPMSKPTAFILDAVQREQNAQKITSKQHKPKDSKQVPANQMETLTSQPGDQQGIVRNQKGVQDVWSTLTIWGFHYTEVKHKKRGFD